MTEEQKKNYEALDTIYCALQSYCEDCCGDDKAEHKRIDRAYEVVRDALGL